MRRGQDAVLGSLKRMLANGPLAHLPGKGSDLDLLLALAAARFVPGKRYRESEVNDVLRAWLEAFCLPGGVDHVTLRRCLVDARLLSRDAAGSTYEVAPRRPGETLADSESNVEPGNVLAEIRREREARKRERATANNVGHANMAGEENPR